MTDPRIESATIMAVQAEKARAIDDARHDFIDELAELVANAIQAGVTPAEVKADIEGCLGVQPDFEDLIDSETETDLGVCPGCGFNVDHDDHQCSGATEAQIRAAVTAVMTSYPESEWGQSDTDQLMVESDGTFVSPQSFGGTFTGSVRRDDSAVIGSEGEFYVVTLDADEAEGIPQIVKVVMR